jgi:Icc-related predicted phosphoesterase
MGRNRDNTHDHSSRHRFSLQQALVRLHAGPTKTLVSARTSGGDAGDPDLTASVSRYAPRLVLSGHVHDPLHWRQRDNSTLFLNPGRNAHADFPNHILVRTDRMSCQFIGALREETHEAGLPAAVSHGAESVTAPTAVA